MRLLLSVVLSVTCLGLAWATFDLGYGQGGGGRRFQSRLGGKGRDYESRGKGYDSKKSYSGKHSNDDGYYEQDEYKGDGKHDEYRYSKYSKDDKKHSDSYHGKNDDNYYVGKHSKNNDYHDDDKHYSKEHKYDGDDHYTHDNEHSYVEDDDYVYEDYIKYSGGGKRSGGRGGRRGGGYAGKRGGGPRGKRGHGRRGGGGRGGDRGRRGDKDMDYYKKCFVVNAHHFTNVKVCQFGLRETTFIKGSSVIIDWREDVDRLPNYGKMKGKRTRAIKFQDICIKRGTALVFFWPLEGAHNVNLFISPKKFHSCKGLNRKPIKYQTHEVVYTDNLNYGYYYFACGIGDHCIEHGMKLSVKIVNDLKDCY